MSHKDDFNAEAGSDNFFDLCRTESAAWLADFLKKNPQAAHARNERGVTALHSAVMDSDFEKVHILLAHGADPSNQNNFGMTVLMSALAVLGPVRLLDTEPEIIVTLLKAGARTDAKNKNGETIFDMAEGRKDYQVLEALKTHAATDSRKPRGPQF